jgi:hypothetical protein
MGLIHLMLGEGAGLSRYSWSRVKTVVHNILVGTLWIEHFGQIQGFGISHIYSTVRYYIAVPIRSNTFFSKFTNIGI